MTQSSFRANVFRKGHLENLEKLLSEWVYPFISFFLLFAIRYPTMMLGINNGDEGYCLSNQFLANAIGSDFVKIAPQWWLSDFIGACWMKLMGSYGIWGARLGGLIGISLITMLSIRMISLVFKPNFSLVLTILSSAIFSFTGKTLYYDNVSLLIYVIFGFFILKTTIDPTKHLYAILSGISLALLILSKWPMMIALLVPSLILGIYYFYNRINAPIFLKSCLILYSFTLISLLLFSVYLESLGLLGNYLSFSGLADAHMSFALHLSLWLWPLRTIIPLLILLFGIPFLYFKFTKTQSIDTVRSSLFLFLSLFLLSILLSFFRSKWFCPFADVHVVHILPCLMCLIISTACIFFLRNSIQIHELALYIIAITLPFGQTLGSASGIAKIFTGLWLMMGVMWNLLLRLDYLNKFKNSKTPLISIGIILSSIAGYYGIQSTFFYVGGIYYTNISILSSKCSTPRLLGIRTTENKKNSFESLVNQIRKHTNKNDRILAYFNIPLIYYATDTLPFGDRVWFEAFLSAEQMKSKAKDFSGYPPPTLIVKTKTDTLHPEWGLNPIQSSEYITYNPDCINKMVAMNDILDSTIKELWDLELIWSNIDFDLFKVSSNERFFRSHDISRP